MSLISLEFLGFLLAVLVFYYLFPLKFKWLLLLAGSIFFYVSTGPDGLPYLTAVSVIAYLAALGMQLLNQKQEQYFRNHEVDKDEKRKQKALNILRWRSHPISWNRAMESVIESHSSDGGSHDPCRGSQ